MLNSRMIASIILFLFILTGICAAESRDGYQALDRTHAGYQSTLTGGVIGGAKAEVDSVVILGGDLGNGDFEDSMGNPDNDGWTSVDLTAPHPNMWNISDYNADNLGMVGPGNLAWWCGTYFDDDCGTGDHGGYGNNWNEILSWAWPSPDPSDLTVVEILADINVDTELEYDRLHLQYLDWNLGEWVDINVFDGQITGLSVYELAVISPIQLAGPGLDEVHLRWAFKSDVAWSDEDCQFTGMGGAQIDNISVRLNSVEVTFDDLETTSGNWVPGKPFLVGDFAQVMGPLYGMDITASNNSPQFVFIDDNLVVLGTGGTMCNSFCNGPMGYVVNHDGGLAGPEFGIHNEIRSPIVEWPEHSPIDYQGLRMALDLYMHLPHFADNPDTYFYWRVRSTNMGYPEALDDATWQTDGMLYYGSVPRYMSFEMDLTPYLEPGKTHVQIALGVFEMDVDGGTDASPAPYIDNVCLTAFEFGGPALTAREGHLAQDNFPEHGDVDYVGLASNNVRFDMARNISPVDDWRNDPGDSIVCTVSVVHAEAQLTTPPEMKYKLNPNPTFDPYRTSGWPLEGSVPGNNCLTDTGAILEDQYYFDLPDTAFLFPGDVLHYFFEATEDMYGFEFWTATMPADTTGFGDFSFESQYPVAFEMRALPTVNSTIPGDHPPFLVINDNPGRGSDNEWDFALGGYGYVEGRDFDLYRVKEPASGLGNGIGGRATLGQLVGYQSILYTCGDLDQYTISNGDYYHDPSDDVSLLGNWLDEGNKNLLATGDNLVFDLTNSGPSTAAFAGARLGVTFVAKDVAPMLGGDLSPAVDTLGISPPVILDPFEWDLLGDEPYVHTFDAVTAACSPGLIFKFPAQGSPYNLSAGTYHHDLILNDQIISLPYGLESIMEQAKFMSDNSLRGRLLREFLYMFGHPDDPASVTGIPDLDLSSAVTAATEPVMLYTRNNGGGYGPLTSMAYGQIETDATITVTLLDSFGRPIVGLPKEDIWLEPIGGNFTPCVGGATADHDTDVDGTTTFTQPLSGGGNSLVGDVPYPTYVMVNGSEISSPEMEIYFNSPDINGDQVTNLMDLAIFAMDYYYPFPGPMQSDFFWDGTINLSDLILFARGFGNDCWESYPTDPAPLPAGDPLPAATVELFFDAEGTQKDIQVGVGVPFGVYVLLLPEDPVNVGGFGYRVAGDPALPVIINHPLAAETSLGTDPDFETGYTQCVPTGPGDPIVVDYMEMMLVAPGRMELTATAITGRYPDVVYGDCAGRLGFDITVGPPARINPLCVIIIDPEPDALDAPWELAWAGGTDSGSGNATLNDMEPGTYSLTWQDAGPDWIEPDPNPVHFLLASGDTATVTGTYHTPLPNLVSIVDVPGDQGGSVELTWERSYFDAAGSSLEITGYEIYRHQETASLARLDQSKDADLLPGWDLLGTEPATGAATYQYVAETLCDSTAAGICWTTLLVRVMTAVPEEYYDSDEMQGYSVDNLFPAVPSGLHVAYLAGGNTLTWDANPDPDIGVYRIYRADMPNTTFPGGTPIAEVATPGWFDDLSGASGSAWDYCYFVSAEDIHDNEGEPTLWSNTEVSGTEDNPLPRAFALQPCYPNPFNPHTTIGFDLPQALAVRLEVFDVSGRLVKILADGKVLPPGRHEEVWDGTNQAGTTVATGVYFCRIQAGEFTQSGRMTLIK